MATSWSLQAALVLLQRHCGRDMADYTTSQWRTKGRECMKITWPVQSETVCVRLMVQHSNLHHDWRNVEYVPLVLVRLNECRVFSVFSQSRRTLQCRQQENLQPHLCNTGSFLFFHIFIRVLVFRQCKLLLPGVTRAPLCTSRPTDVTPKYPIYFMGVVQWAKIEL